MSTPRLRPAVRALILNPSDEVLLVHFQLRTSDFWATPGGGIELGETELDALKRELREEVGLHEPVAVGPIWKRSHEFPMKHWDGQMESFYLVRTPHFDPQPAMTVEELLAEGVVELRWWSVEAIRQSSIEFAPRNLAELVSALIADGPPTAPVHIGV